MNYMHISKLIFSLMWLELFLLKDYCLVVGRRFVHPNDLESYVGGSISSC
jgi:hypothetical protein